MKELGARLPPVLSLDHFTSPKRQSFQSASVFLFESSMFSDVDNLPFTITSYPQGGIIVIPRKHYLEG
jgi:hypothetical protein